MVFARIRPRELHSSLDRFGSGIPEENPVEPRHLRQLFRQWGLVSVVNQVGDVQQRVGGIVPHGHDLRMCVTQRINREPAEKIQVPFALLVV